MAKWNRNLSLLNRIRIFTVSIIAFPFTIMVFFGIFQYAKIVENNVVKNACDKMEFAIRVVHDRLANIEEDINSIPYDYILNDIYTSKSKGLLGEEEAYAQLNSYLFSRIAGRPYIKMASFYFLSDPASPYMYSFSQTYSKYMSSMHHKILNFAAEYEPILGYFVDDSGDVFVVKKLYDRYSFQQFGVIVFQIDQVYLLDSVYNMAGQEAGAIIQYAGGPELAIGRLEDADKESAARKLSSVQEEAGTQYSSLGKRYLIYGAMQKQNLNMKYATFMPTGSYKQEYFRALIIPALIILLATPVLVALANAIYRNTMVPISELVSKMKLLQSGELGIQAKTERKDELGFVLDSFNEMSKELKRLVNRILQEEMALKNAQLKALQLQINPHFLYNTLDIISWKARLLGDEEIPSMISSLGMLLDASLTRDGQKYITIMEELRNIEAYLYLLRIRYGKKLAIVLDADTGILDAYVPKLIIQPVLENAVYHGIEPVGGGSISIELKQEGSDLICTVKDDGAGMSEEALQRLREDIENSNRDSGSSTRIGLVNVHERIKLTYGEGYGVTIESKKGEGTTVTLKMNLNAKL